MVSMCLLLLEIIAFDLVSSATVLVCVLVTELDFAMQKYNVIHVHIRHYYVITATRAVKCQSSSLK